jgi:hypothetical protein
MLRFQQRFFIAFLGGGLGEPLFGQQRVVPPENTKTENPVFSCLFFVNWI